MDPDKRIDYFRSELEGKIAELRKDLEATEKALSERLARLVDSVDKLTRELQHARLGR